MKKRLLPLLLAMGLLSIIFSTACGGNNNTPSTSVTVAVTPATASVATGATQQFTATITGSSNTNVVWQVNGTTGGSSTVGTVDVNGLYTAPTAVPSPATVTVTAISQADTTKSASATVTVTTGTGTTVTISPTTATVAPSATQQFTATVANATNTAVTWQVNGTTGGSSTVGTIDTTGLYTAPATIPSPATVTVAAISQADTTQSASATVTISTTPAAFSNASLNGTYVFRWSGFNITSPSSVASVLAAGTVTADGNGNISAGQEDLNDGATGQAQQLTLTGTYSISSDGRGTMNLSSTSATLTLDFVVLSDGSTRFIVAQTSFVGSGKMEKQDANALTAASLAGTYAFDLQGDSQVGTTSGPLATSGVLTFDANGAITAGTQDINNQGTVTQNVSVTGTYALVASSGGRATVTLTNTSGTTKYAVYIVSASTLYWVETDFPFPALGGESDRQTGGPFSQSSVSGDFVFNTLGATTTGPLARAGKFRLDGNGAVTSGVYDENNNGTIASNVNITGGTYTVSSDGRLLATLTTSGTSVTVAGVLISANRGFLIGTETSSTSGGEFFSQRAPQSGGAFSNADLNGPLGGALSGVTTSGPEAVLLQMTADGAGNMTGTLDGNDFGTVLSGQNSTATYTISSNGRGTLSLTGGGKTRTFAFYLATGNRIVLVNQDTGELLTGPLLPQS